MQPLPLSPTGSTRHAHTTLGNTRYWAVIDADNTLVCLGVYRKGAEEVVRLLAGQARCRRA